MSLKWCVSTELIKNLRHVTLYNFYYRSPNTGISLNPFSRLVSIVDALQVGGNDLQYFCSVMDHCSQTARNRILFHNFASSLYRTCSPAHRGRPHTTSRDVHAGSRHSYIHDWDTLVERCAERWSWTSRLVKAVLHSKYRIDVLSTH
jgi:hypothetical protein